MMASDSEIESTGTKQKDHDHVMNGVDGDDEEKNNNLNAKSATSTVGGYKQHLFLFLNYIFTISDVFHRITPILLIVSLIADDIMSIGIFGIWVIVLAGYEFVILKRMLIDKSMKNKLKYIFLAGTISSSFYLLSAFELRYLPTFINFDSLYKYEIKHRLVFH